MTPQAIHKLSQFLRRSRNENAWIAYFNSYKPKERLMILQIKDAWFRLLEHYGSKIGNYGWRKRWINRQVGTGYLNSRA